MMNKNKNLLPYDVATVNGLVLTNFKHSVMIVSLLTNLTVLVSWMVLQVA